MEELNTVSCKLLMFWALEDEGLTFITSAVIHFPHYLYLIIAYSFPLSVLLSITDDIIKCSKLQVEPWASWVVSLNGFGISSHHLLSIRVQTVENYITIFFTTNLNHQESEQVSECVAWQITSASVLIMAGSQSETRTVAFCCKKNSIECSLQ